MNGTHVVPGPRGFHFAGKVPVQLVYEVDEERASMIARFGGIALKSAPRRYFETARAAWIAAAEEFGIDRCAQPGCACQNHV